MAKTKNVKRCKYFIASELFRSHEIPDYLKNLLQPEPATYRITKQEGQLTPKEKRESREVVKIQKNIKVAGENGEEREVTFNLVEFDKTLRRYYLEASTLEELNDFFDEVAMTDIPYTIESTESLKEKNPKFLELCFGLEDIDGYVIHLEDGFLADMEMEEEEEE